jgi:ATP/maltotriose-dependent transcriptional regulator MalT
MITICAGPVLIAARSFSQPFATGVGDLVTSRQRRLVPARLRLVAPVAELHDRDLRLTGDKAELFALQGAVLSPDALAMLCYSEGWVAGLRFLWSLIVGATRSRARWHWLRAALNSYMTTLEG